MGTRRKLINFSRLLGNIPSLAYGVFYLLLIPAFALVYYKLPLHFYHSTLQHEASLTSNFEQIRKDLSDMSIERFQIMRGDPESSSHADALANDWRVSFERFDNLEIDDKEVSFYLYVFAMKVDTSVRHKLPFVAATSFPLKVRFDVGEPPTYESTKPHPSETKNWKVDFLTERREFKDLQLQIAVKQALFPDGRFDGNYMGMEMRNSLMRQIRNYAIGNKGYGSAIDGNFVRMFYLSSATITTLGYGDIVPITTTARVLVAVEAILGIVVIGLFLNSLSFERTQLETEVKSDEAQATGPAHPANET